MYNYNVLLVLIVMINKMQTSRSKKKPDEEENIRISEKKLAHNWFQLFVRDSVEKSTHCQAYCICSTTAIWANVSRIVEKKKKK